MKKLIVLVCLPLFISCENIKGTLTILSPLKLNDRGSVDTLGKGKYSASMKFRKKKIRLVITKNSGKDSYTFVLPANAKLPSKNGSFFLTSAQVKQPYDIGGNLKTTKTIGRTTRGHEACTYEQRRRVCYPQGGCTIRTIIIHGQREVQYRPVRTQKDLQISLLKRRSNLAAAKFLGRDVQNTREYDYQGICY